MKRKYTKLQTQKPFMVFIKRTLQMEDTNDGSSVSKYENTDMSDTSLKRVVIKKLSKLPTYKTILQPTSNRRKPKMEHYFDMT